MTFSRRLPPERKLAPGPAREICTTVTVSLPPYTRKPCPHKQRAPSAPLETHSSSMSGQKYLPIHVIASGSLYFSGRAALQGWGGCVT
jgi:hypothetical protein